jgi:putative hydrolase of the HAD superfamily
MITAGADIKSVYHAGRLYNEQVQTTPRVSAVLFDLDDTLFDHAFGARAALRRVHELHACFGRWHFDAFERKHAEYLEALHERVVAGEIDIDAARMERFRRLFDAADVDAGDALLRDTAATYRTCYLASRRPVDGAVELLTALKPRVRIGIVSNNLLQEQQDKVRQCGFEPFLDALVVSEEAGVAKPDPAIFAIALDRLGCAPAETVMIGDAWVNDIRGARAAGIRSIWFNPAGRAIPEPLSDVRELRSLAPVSTALAAIFDPAFQCASA